MSADANPALQQLGRRLVQAREASGRSLEEHADRLNMGREQLQALEAGNRDGLPEPVFVIAQARRVAASLGIEIDQEIAALRGSDGFQIPRASRAPAQPLQQNQTGGQDKRPERPRGQRQGQGRTAEAAAGRQGQISAPKPTGAPSTTVPVTLLAVIVLLAAAAGLIGLRQALPRRTPAQSTPTSPNSPTTAPLAASEMTSGAAGDGASKAAGPPADPVPGRTTTARQGDLVLRPSAPSWVHVRSPEGTTLFRGTLESEKRFPLKAELEVLAGRPDLVQVGLGPAPAVPMGRIEDVRWRRFRAPAP